jgi:uncharacterized protein YdaU (DUF1376 family)
MSKAPWFKFFAGDFLLDPDVDSMPREAEALLVRMWCICHLEGSCPADPEELARKTRCTLQYVLHCKPHCDPFFDLKDGRLYSRRMEEERRRSEQARANANARYKQKGFATGTADGSANGRADRGANSYAQSQSQNQGQGQRQIQNQGKGKIFAQTAFAREGAAHRKNGTSSGHRPTEADLEQLYRTYPRKRDPLAAKKAIRKAITVVMNGDADHPAMPVEDSLDFLSQRVALYAECVRGCDRNYVPYPASWFNRGAYWDDEGDWRKWKVMNGSGSNGEDVIGDVANRLAHEIA